MTKPGSKLKLAKKGIRSRQNYLQIGDMYVKIHSILPKTVPKELIKMITKITK